MFQSHALNYIYIQRSPSHMDFWLTKTHTDLYESDRCKGYLRVSVSTAWFNHQVPGKVFLKKKKKVPCKSDVFIYL